MAQLVIQPGDGASSTREIESERITLGSGPLNSVVMPTAPEGCKAEITLENGEYHFRNLGPYGTATLNYISVTQGTLHDGDTLRFGKVECVFRAPATAAAPLPAVEESPSANTTLVESLPSSEPATPEPVFADMEQSPVPDEPPVAEEMPVPEETPAHKPPSVFETPSHEPPPVSEAPSYEPPPVFETPPPVFEMPHHEPPPVSEAQPHEPPPVAELPSYEPEPSIPAAAAPPPIPVPAVVAPPIPAPAPIAPPPPIPPAPVMRPPMPPPVPSMPAAPPPVPSYSAAPPVPSYSPAPPVPPASPAPPAVPPGYPSAPPNYQAPPPGYPSTPPGYPPAPSNYPPAPPPANVTAALPPMPLPTLASIAPLPTEAVEAAARVKPNSYFGKIAQVFRATYREARRRVQLSTLDSRLRAARETETPKAYFHVGFASYRAQVIPESFGPHYAQIADLESRLVAARQQVLANAQRGVAQGQAEVSAYEGHLRNAFTALGAAVAQGNRQAVPPGLFEVLLPVEGSIETLQKQHAILTADATSRAELSDLLGELRHDTAQGLRHAGTSLSSMVSGEEAVAEEPAFTLPDRVPLKDRTTIGRDPSSDLVLPGVNISQKHLEIVRHGNEFVVYDQMSTLGTFLNGQRITQPTPIREGDRLRVGKTTFALYEGALLPSSEKNNTRITVQQLTKTVISLDTKQPLNLLENVNLVIEPKEFVALLGPSGSGKSTFMDAINGRRRASSGKVMVNSDDFYESYQYYRRAIGYVPQQDIVHTSLTVRQALRFSAQMRLPADTTKEDIEGIITGVIKKLGLAERTHTRISNLSGGQLKRVSLGVELISDPSLLFLDEATSGLDAGTEGKMMTLFRKIADDGTTVVCITHNVENVYICNMVVLLVRGRLTYYGPPADMPGYFGVAKISDVYDVLEGQPAEHWAQRYEASELYRKFVVGRMPTRGVPVANPGMLAAPPPPGYAPPPGMPPVPGAPPIPTNMPPPVPGAPPIPGSMPPIPGSTPPPVPTMQLPPRGGQSQTAELRASRDPRQTTTNFLRQYRVLRQRYSLITLQDKKNLTILLAQAPIISVLIGLALWGKAKFSPNGDPKADMEQVVLFLMVVSAVWFGCSNATKEIVKELPIYKRERAINLEIMTYLLSKVTVLSVVCALQCLMLVLIIIPLTGADISFFGSFAVIYLTSLASMMMGLTVSSLVDNTDKANTITPLLLIPQVVFAGCIVPLENVVMKTLAAFLIIAYWGFDGMVNLVPEGQRVVNTAVGPVGVIKGPEISSLAADLFFLLLMLAAFFGASIWGLRRKDTV